MYVESFKNNGIPYLRLVRSDRVTNKKGIKTATKTVVFNIGPLSRYDDGQPDYVERLKKSFKAGQPLIVKLRHRLKLISFPYRKAVRTASVIPDSFLMSCSKK